MADFAHPSRPGHYGVVFDDDLRSALAVLVTALLPGDDVYPCAAAARVVDFIEARSSASDHWTVQSVVARCAHDSAEIATAALQQLQVDDPGAFTWLYEFACYGYYASGRVLSIMADQGYAYHGAPQPLGYHISQDMLAPSAARGSYQATGQVTRVQDR